MRMTVWTEESMESTDKVLVHWKYDGQHYSTCSVVYKVTADTRIHGLRKYAREHGYRFVIAL